MYQARRFLLLDPDTEGRFLLSKTILRKYTKAVVLECADQSTALNIAAAESPDAIIVHVGPHGEAAYTVARLRRVRPEALLLALVEDPEHCSALLEAGATRCHELGQWLLVANIIQEMIRDSHRGPDGNSVSNFNAEQCSG